MKVLVLGLVAALSLFSSIASADIITASRYMIRQLWDCNSDAYTSSDPETDLKSRFTEITVDYFSRTIPDVNIIVVHGKHQLTDIDGHLERYDESIMIEGEEFWYTVALLHGGRIKMQGDGGFQNLRIRGNCKKAGKKVWTCE